MEPLENKEVSDRDVRHFIYAIFAETSRPPTIAATADFFKIPIASIENAYERLAQAHNIALAPGSHTIWMAHPFLGLQLTKFIIRYLQFLQSCAIGKISPFQREVKFFIFHHTNHRFAHFCDYIIVS